MNNPVPVAVDPPPVPNTVILHLYRPHRLMAAVQKPDVYVDGIKITKIENSQVIQMVPAPGRHCPPQKIDLADIPRRENH